TAAGTDDGSSGVQFAVTDLSVTQYDASGFAHPVNLRHTLLVPGPPAGATVADGIWAPSCSAGPAARTPPTACTARRR
ncbi:hypothetical protein H7H37_20250, partial [Mycolicibacterium insubricum]|nr:hypothetical protein [Mycolicibacterium insubricum]